VNLQFREGYAPRAGMQALALEALANTDTKYVLLSAPVGSCLKFFYTCSELKRVQ
jgi:hypothetical protein